MNTLSKQLSELEKIHKLYKFFHPPKPNNYVFQLVPNSVELEGYQQRIASQTSGMNKADKALLNICLKLARGKGNETALKYINDWSSCLSRRTNLQSIYWATQTIASLEEQAEFRPFSSYIQKTHPELRDIFIQACKPVQRILRVNAYTSDANVSRLLETISEELENEKFYTSIERVEVAKILTDEAEKLSAYPRLIIYLKDDSPLKLRPALRAIEKLLEEIPAQKQGLRATYAYPWLRNATVTQGYYLFKTYLELLGYIDEIYDRKSGYAFSIDDDIGALFARGRAGNITQ